MKRLARYTLMMSMPFMGMGFNACQEYEHPVVIEGLGSLGPNDCFAVVRDENDSTKVFIWDHEPGLFKNLQLGDSAKIICYEGFYNQEAYYQNHNIISFRDANMTVYGATLAERNPGNKLMQQIRKDGLVNVH